MATYTKTGRVSKRRDQYTFRMNTEENERLKRLARRYKMSESAVIRYLIYEADTRRV